MAVTNLQHVGLAVPDIQTGLDFYGDAGLETYARDGMGVVGCQGRSQDQLRLIEGARKKLHHLCFGTTEAGLASIRANLESNGVQLLDAPNESPDEGLWVRDPDGIYVNIKIADAAPSFGGPDALGNQIDWPTNTPGHFERRGVRAAPQERMSMEGRINGNHFLDCAGPCGRVCCKTDSARE